MLIHEHLPGRAQRCIRIELNREIAVRNRGVRHRHVPSPSTRRLGESSIGYEHLPYRSPIALVLQQPLQGETPRPLDHRNDVVLYLDRRHVDQEQANLQVAYTEVAGTNTHTTHPRTLGRKVGTISDGNAGSAFYRARCTLGLNALDVDRSTVLESEYAIQMGGSAAASAALQVKIVHPDTAAVAKDQRGFKRTSCDS